MDPSTVIASFKAMLAAFFDTPAGLSVKGLMVGAFLVFILGVLAAKRDGSFKWSFVDSFVRSTIWGRVAPVLAVLLIGYMSDEALIIDAGVLTAGVVATGMIAAALASIGHLTSPVVVSNAENTPPTA